VCSLEEYKAKKQAAQCASLTLYIKKLMPEMSNIEQKQTTAWFSVTTRYEALLRRTAGCSFLALKTNIAENLEEI
jgi:hypothetical protein